jgi:hypothetical protein
LTVKGGRSVKGYSYAAEGSQNVSADLVAFDLVTIPTLCFARVTPT